MASAAAFLASLGIAGFLSRPAQPEKPNERETPVNDQRRAFETNAIHVSQEPVLWHSRAVVPPISLASTFLQKAPNELEGYEYSRVDNPTRHCLEALLASLEKAKFAHTFGSGVAAAANVMLLLESGDHIVSFDDIYGGVSRIFRNYGKPLGISVDFVDVRDLRALAKACKTITKLVWIESPSNPTMKIVDIAAVSKVVKERAPQALVVVDNTFMSPYFQNPLTLGADIVVHSITKYINGHSDVLMGCTMTNNEGVHKRLKSMQTALGAVPSPFDCYLVIRGIKTLAVRMRRHQENVFAIAEFLDKHPKVEKVLFPGFETHPQHELAKRQSSGFSGMLSFYIKGGMAQSRMFLTSLKIFTLADSLGAVESLASLPTLMSHGSEPPEMKKKHGITDSLIRLSVGVEDVRDLIADLDQALKLAVK